MIQTTATGRTLIISTGQQAEYQGFQIEFNYDNVKNIIGVDSYGHAFCPATGTAINDGAWHTVLVTFDGTTVRIYVDGRLDNLSTHWYNPGAISISTTMNTQGNNIFLGRSQWGGNLWKGSLKNVMFYDYVISVSSSTGRMLFSSGKVL